MSRIAVSIHDVEPATFERCALIRDWLTDHGIDRVTLLVIPARDMHPFHDRSPALARWLGEQVALGDCVAQHGFQDRRVARGGEFAGLDDAATRRTVLAGRRVLHLAGVEPRGFVAPGYVYTPSLQRILAGSYDWWASLRRVWSDHGQRSAYAPALMLGASTLRVRAGARLAGELLRLELRPADLDRPRHIGAVEAVLRRALDRAAVTYDDL